MVYIFLILYSFVFYFIFFFKKFFWVIFKAYIDVKCLISNFRSRYFILCCLISFGIGIVVLLKCMKVINCGFVYNWGI